MENKTAKTQVCFIAFEASPFSKTGGLGDVAGSLPRRIASSCYDVRVILPRLSIIPEKYLNKMKYIGEYGVSLSWRNQGFGLYELRHDGIIFYFIDNRYYFSRPRVYGEFDDGERVAFFSKSALECLQYIPDFSPDILHCNDWHTALVPVFLREHYMKMPEYRKIKTVFTIHNLKFQGKYTDALIGDVLGLQGTPAEEQLRQGRAVNFLQGAVIYADRVTTVSSTYADEICSPYYGEGLSWLFNERREKLSGIINGIDEKSYNPETDTGIFVNYSTDSIDQKAANKSCMQNELGFAESPDTPLLAIISRLTEQKGLDLVTYILPELTRMDIQLAILGVGDHQFEEAFSWYTCQCGSHIQARITFDEAFSRKLYAASDAILIPSRFEPCGLTQMISMKYGTLPIVRETGGLKDTVTPYNRFTGEGNGFSFANYNAHELLHTIETAADIYRNDRKAWKKMQSTAMNTDFSWKVPARQYRKLYTELTGR